MRKFIIIRGIPGSGKSFLANSLLTKYPGAVILSTDNYFVDLDGQYKWDRTMIEEAHAHNFYLFLVELRKLTPVVILDNTNTTLWEFEKYVNRAKKSEYEIEILEPDTPWKFDVDELVARNQHGVDRPTIERMVNRWESTASILQKIAS